MNKKQWIILSLFCFIVLFPQRAKGSEIDYPSNGATTFYGTYEPILEPGPSVPNNGDQKIEIIEEVKHQELPQTGELSDEFRRIVGFFLCLVVGITWKQQLKENENEKNQMGN